MFKAPPMKAKTVGRPGVDWDELHERYTVDLSGEFSDDDDPKAARGGAVIVGQMRYLSLYVGASNIVMSGDEMLTQAGIKSYDTPLWAKITNNSGAFDGWASTVIPIYLLGGLQLLAIGVVGEYVGKMYMEVKKRPMYQIEEILEPEEDATSK